MNYDGKLTGKYADSEVGVEGIKAIKNKFKKIQYYNEVITKIEFSNKDVDSFDFSKFEKAYDDVYSDKLKAANTVGKLNKFISKTDNYLTKTVLKNIKELDHDYTNEYHDSSLELSDREKKKWKKVYGIDKKLAEKYLKLAKEKLSKMEKK